MAKPIPANPILTGEAAKWFRRYLANAKPSPAKEKEHEETMKTFKWPVR